MENIAAKSQEDGRKVTCYDLDCIYVKNSLSQKHNQLISFLDTDDHYILFLGSLLFFLSTLNVNTSSRSLMQFPLFEGPSPTTTDDSSSLFMYIKEFPKCDIFKGDFVIPKIRQFPLVESSVSLLSTQNHKMHSYLASL